MERQPQITVLLAAYQGEEYIAQQLDSILNQTVLNQQKQNPVVPKLQIIASDDGSTDGTREILEEYSRNYPEQVVLCHHEKMGVYQSENGAVPPAAMNFFWLLGQARGDYVMLSDQDDVWKPHKTERLLAKMRELEELLGPEMPILVHSDMEVVDASLQQISPSFFRYQKASPHRNSLAQVLVENPVTGGAVMINRPLLELLQDVPKACVMHDWWIALVASCFGVIAYVPEALYLYRQHDHNTLGAKQIGSAAEIKERLGRQDKVNETYRRMFAQAIALEERYGGEMAVQKRLVLRAYRALRYQSPIGRLRNIVRNHFFKSSLLQTFAQCVTIPKAEKLLL